MNFTIIEPFATLNEFQNNCCYCVLPCKVYPPKGKKYVILRKKDL